ncbi:Uncharacterised protein [uncultured archaeon]|nr:Uncharacterised protein [uncultured archaeon]
MVFLATKILLLTGVNMDTEIGYLCVEAHECYGFLKKLRAKGEVGIVPNLSYGLMAVSPILPRLRNDQYPIYLSKVGSSEAHNDPLVMGTQASLPLDLLGTGQPHFVVFDGTRNTGGSSRDNDKYPDSQQGYLNYAIALNDFITSNNAEAYRKMMGVSTSHIQRLRGTTQYRMHRTQIEQGLGVRTFESPYSFKYWNPADLTLALLNHGDGCDRSTSSLRDIPERPTIVFVNSVMPSNYHSREHRAQWGEHAPAYFDDNNRAKEFQFSFDSCGVYLTSGLGKSPVDVYEELYGKAEVAKS